MNSLLVANDPKFSVKGETTIWVAATDAVTFTVAAPPFEVIESVPASGPAPSPVRSTVTVIVAGVVVVAPVADETLNQDKLSVSVQFSVPVPVLLIVKVDVVVCAPKSNDKGATDNIGIAPATVTVTAMVAFPPSDVMVIVAVGDPDSVLRSIVAVIASVSLVVVPDVALSVSQVWSLAAVQFNVPVPVFRIVNPRSKSVDPKSRLLGFTDNTGVGGPTTVTLTATFWFPPFDVITTWPLCIPAVSPVRSMVIVTA
ncbi:MAG: hypothetical protein HZB26_09455 [Candidatus Hydrogenedentes bacterium]|nr:hypothetical protein [Candidatus Hydrogenedentota bacterium]